MVAATVKPESAPSTGSAEEEDERDRGRAGVGGMSRGKRRPVRLEHVAGRALPADGRLDQVGEQWGERLGGGERRERGPAAREEERASDPGQCEGAPDAVPERVEHERDVREERRLDVLHQLGSAAVDRERARGYQEREQKQKREECAAPADCAARPGEELLGPPPSGRHGCRRPSVPSGGHGEQPSQGVESPFRQRGRR